jgi:hypothetical protein
MADDVAIKFIYPPNFDKSFPDHNPIGNRRFIVQLTSISDGTGEDMAVKLRRTDLVATSGNPPSELIVEKIEYDVADMAVVLEFSGNNVDDTIAILNDSNGGFDFSPDGLRINSTNPDDDPEWGNILLSTEQTVAGATYNITMTVRAKE